MDTHSQHALTTTNTVAYFKYSHPHMDRVSKPIITFVVNDLKVTTTYNEVEYIYRNKKRILQLINLKHGCHLLLGS